MAESPKALFKYVGPDRIDIIEKLRVRFTPPSCFNDPFEANFCLDGLLDAKVMGQYFEVAGRRSYRAYLLRRCREGGQPITFEVFQRHEAERNHAIMEQIKGNPRAAKERVAGRAQKFWDTVGILSLTANEHSLLMWAHYGNSHEGLVIEFNPNDPFFQPPAKPSEIDLGALFKVNYSGKRPRHVIGETVPPYHFTVKSGEWEYEEEWRVFELLERSDYTEAVGNQTIHLFKLRPKTITRIICGCRMKEENRERLFQAVSKNPHLRHVSLLQATIDVDTFGLQYRRVNLARQG